MFHGNESSRGELIPDCPSGAEPIGAFGVIKHDRGRLTERVLYSGSGHRGEAYHEALLRLKPLYAVRSEVVEMVDELTQPTGASAIGDEG